MLPRGLALFAQRALFASVVIYAAFPFFAGASGSSEKDASNTYASNAYASNNGRNVALAEILKPSEATLSALFQPSEASLSAPLQYFVSSGAEEIMPPLQVKPISRTGSGLRTTSSTNAFGMDLFGLGNVLSKLLSLWPSLESNIADAESLVTALTKIDGATVIVDGVLGANKALLSKLVEALLASKEFPRLKNWVLLLLAIVNDIICTCRVPALRQMTRFGGLPTMIESIEVRREGTNDDMMQTILEDIVRDAAVGTDTTNSQIYAFADALRQKVVEPAIEIVAEKIQDALDGNRRLQDGIIFTILDEILISVPQDIESFLFDTELANFCIIYDSISFAAKAAFRVTARIINELVELFLNREADDANFIIQREDLGYFLSIPERLALCGVGGLIRLNPISLPESLDFGICLGLNLLPLVPILFRMYIATFTTSFKTTESGVAVSSPNYLSGEQDSDTTTLGFYTGELRDSSGFYELTCSDFEEAFDEFQDGLQRLVSYEQVLVDKSFASTRLTSNVLLNEDEDGCDIFNHRPLGFLQTGSGKSNKSGSGKSASKSNSFSLGDILGGSGKSNSFNKGDILGGSGKSNSWDIDLGGGSKRRRLRSGSDSGKKKKSCMSKRPGKSGKSHSSMSHSQSRGECKTRECDSFVSAGVKNSQTCDAIDRGDLNYLGSNCKIMTQIILDRFECDEHIKNHLFDRYCDESNNFFYDEVDLPFLTRTPGCTKENMCNEEGRAVCTVHDLPILKTMFMPGGALPKYMNGRPFLNLTNLADTLEDVNAIPTLYTLRHFGSNQLPALDLIIMAISSHLTGEVNAGRQPEPSLPLIIFQLLGSLPGFDIDAILGDPALRGILFASGQDPLIYSLIRRYFLGEMMDDKCGPSFGVINRDAFRRFFSFDDSELCNNQNQASPVEDYASIFASLPLLADVGHKVTILEEGSPYYNRHPYNNDHDLLSLTLSVYFGNSVVIDCYEYNDIFEYIQHTIMGPIGIDEEGWYFPGSKSPADSPVLSGDAVSLTVEAIPGVVRDLLPLKIEQGINDFIPNSYAVLLSDSQEYVERYFFSDADYAPWLGQGTCFMSSEAWTALYSDHYINGGTSATTPQGYTFRNGGDHEFSTIANNKRDFWSTLGEEFDEETTAGFFPNSVITDAAGNLPDGCKAFGWGAYSSGYITVTDCPSSCTGTVDARDVSVSYISNQLDIFGLSFKSIYLLILANIINALLVNPGNPDDVFNENPVNINALSSSQAEQAKIGSFLFAALGESIFGSDLPPIDMEVADTCQTSSTTLPVCGIICDYCNNTVPSVCGNSFLLDGLLDGNPVELSVPDIGALLSGPLQSLTDLIVDDRSINCREVSDWESVCSTATTGYCSI